MELGIIIKWMILSTQDTFSSMINETDITKVEGSFRDLKYNFTLDITLFVIACIGNVIDSGITELYK